MSQSLPLPIPHARSGPWAAVPLAALALAALALGGCVTAPNDGDPGAAAVTDSQALEGSPFAGWQQRTFPGKAVTSYRLQPATDLPGERFVLRTEAERSASMLFRRLDPAAPQPERVQFGWKVETMPTRASLADRSTEDSAVRVILAFDGDHARLPLRDRLVFDLATSLTGEAPPYAMLMYVWDVTSSREAIVSSNSTSRIRKIVLDADAGPLGVWRLYDRAIREDFRRAYGEEPGPLIGVGVMSDADNTQSRVRAWYAPVRLIGPG